MRSMTKSLLVLVVVCSAGVAVAGPLDKNAASKVNGDMIGRALVARAYNYNMGGATIAQRSFSYSPAPVQTTAPQVAAAVPAPPVQAAPQAAPARRYSYQPATAAPRYYGNATANQPNYLRVDKKVLSY